MKYKKLILIGTVFLLIVTIVLAIGNSRLFTVKNTEIVDGEYLVYLEGEGITPVFTEEEYTRKDFDIVQEIEDRLVQHDTNVAYDERLRNGQDGCPTTSWCHANGWLNDTVCYKGQCWDSDKTYQLDDTDQTKKQELDSTLGVNK